ncbi:MULTISPECIES: MFS transporter [Acinetobacter]|jgi:MHS family alpha-ketoglutarate permease-like MFS transporter|uniref:MFS transporter n=1 Tax=Acinetobacter TaxID=469 RepID=UPI0022727E36|nr:MULTISPECIES: MFS transporter [Acinetobacter]GLG83277.1 MFS transporter [Acinetobacter calcoaceticus]
MTSFSNIESQSQQVVQKDIKKSLIASGVGNLLEWYDWTIYAVASVYIASALFDKTDPTSALLNTLAVFAVGFVSRPIGGFVFGPLANKYGRKNIMLVTMVMMALASLMIAFIPSYEEIGAWASGLLLIARLVQGFAHGGETATSYAYIAEIAPPKRRGLWSSMSFFAVGAGSLLATLFLALLNVTYTDQQMHEWAWRIPFAIGGGLAFFAIYLRRNMIETHIEKNNDQMSDDVNWPFSKIMKVGIKLFFYEAGSTLTFYTWVTCAAIYAIGIQKMPAKDAFMMSCIAQVIYLICLPFQGRLSDYIGRNNNSLITYIGSSLLLFPLWSLISNEPWTLLVAQSIGLFTMGFLMSCKPAAMSEQIPTKYRTNFLGFFMSLAVTIFGGTASYVNTWLYSIDKGWIFNVYLIVVSLIASIAVLTWKNNKGIDLDQVK